MKLELTEQEAGALLQLLDHAVRAGGLKVAAAAAHFHGKIDEAAKAGKGPNGNAGIPIDDFGADADSNGGTD